MDSRVRGQQFTTGNASEAYTLAARTVPFDVTPLNDAPTGRPTITGAAVVGGELTASTAAIQDVEGLPSSFTYQWIRVAGETESNIRQARATGKVDFVRYTLTRQGDTASELTVTVTFEPFEGNDWNAVAGDEKAEVEVVVIDGPAWEGSRHYIGRRGASCLG